MNWREDSFRNPMCNSKGVTPTPPAPPPPAHHHHHHHHHQHHRRHRQHHQHMCNTAKARVSSPFSQTVSPSMMSESCSPSRESIDQDVQLTLHLLTCEGISSSIVTSRTSLPQGPCTYRCTERHCFSPSEQESPSFLAVLLSHMEAAHYTSENSRSAAPVAVTSVFDQPSPSAPTSW